MANGVFVIERKIQGRKFHVSTRCKSLRAAMRQLERFETDPVGYRPVAEEKLLVLDEALQDEFFKWHEKRVSREWALTVQSLLTDWANHFKGRDLRRLNLITDIKPHLAGATMPHHRVKALRALTKWLREERGGLTRANDATLDLPVPILKAAQITEENAKDVAWADFVKVMGKLTPEVRDVAEVLAASGWHISEIQRFASGGFIRARKAGDKRHVVGVIGTVHKSGKIHTCALVHREHYDAAMRIKARGHVFGRWWLLDHLKKACDAAKVARFGLGAMRHSSSTWLTENGVPVADTSSYIGHASTATTTKHYINMRTPKTVLPRAALRVVK